MFVLIFFALLAGIATILAPCILPILPVVLSAGITGGKRRPLGIVTGLVVSFTFFTLTLSALTRQLGISPDLLRNLAIIILLLFGLLMLVPKFFVVFELFISRFLPKKQAHSERTDYWGGVLVGVSLGLVWTPCVGPIVASVITLAATSTVTFSSVLITAAYALGTSVPLLVLLYGGQNLMKKVRVLNKNTARIQQIFGLVMVLTAISMLLGFDRTIQAQLLSRIPSKFSAGITQQLEQTATVKDEIKKLKESPVANLPILGTAPDFTGISGWINSDPLTMTSLKGKVVLVDFWTYSCINCIRTLPHVTSWYDTYKDQGFVVVGVHSPEFAFEKVTENVRKATVQYGIHYPIAQDNDLATWSAYNNQYWPAHYLIDAQGKVRETHFGEGNYDETEASIRALLAEAHAAAVLPTVVPINDTTPSNSSTPETYLGSARRSHFVEGVSAENLKGNQWTLTGKWEEDDESITTLEKDAGLSFNFGAQDVYLVINPPAGVTASVKVLIDGQPASSEGTDVVGGVVVVNTDRLYHLAHFSKKESHVLTLVFQTTGTKAFAFTFG